MSGHLLPHSLILNVCVSCIPPLCLQQCATKTSGSMLETDDRFTMFGFSVMDFGCCKAISHPTWGTRVMVGAVFTDAPADEVEAVMAALIST